MKILVYIGVLLLILLIHLFINKYVLVNYKTTIELTPMWYIIYGLYTYILLKEIRDDI